MRITISVIVPLFNAEKYIERTLKSILGQSYLPDEIIVVDDGSTDSGSSKALNCLEGSAYTNFKIISTVNRGHASAANTGVQEASSEYVALIDSDDTWTKDKLQKVHAVLSKTNNPPEVVFSKFLLIDEFDQPYHIQNNNQVFLGTNLWERLITEGNVIYGSNSGVVIKRESFINENGYDVKLVACEDWDLWIRLAKRYNFSFIPESLVNIRVHANNQSGNKKLMFGSLLEVLSKHISDISESKIEKMLILKMILKHQSRNVLKFYFSNDYKLERKQVSIVFKMKFIRIRTFLPVFTSIAINKAIRLFNS